MMARLLAPVPIAILSVWFSSATVAAQTGEHPTTLAAAAGIATPLHADLAFNGASWDVALRTRIVRAVSIEGVYSEWRHTDERIRQNMTVQTMTGAVGSIGRLTQETRYVVRTVGVNVLLRHSFSHAVLWGGGGPAFMVLTRNYEQTESGCQGPVSCDGFSNRHTGSALAAQGTLGLDVPLGSRLSVFGHVGFALPVRDAGSGHTIATAGIRIGL